MLVFNQLTGSIPPELRELDLEELDLDGNTLADDERTTNVQLLVAQLVLLAAVFSLPFLSYFRARLGAAPVSASSLRALSLPNGSVRAMIALLSIGSFVNVLVFGDLGGHFERVVTAFGTLNGAIIGFYFGGRLATPPPGGTPPGGTPPGGTPPGGGLPAARK